MKAIKISLITIVLLLSSIKVISQSSAHDSLFHPYRVNYWVTVPIITVGFTTNLLGIPQILNKQEVSLIEMASLNKSIINGIDSWALNLDPSKMSDFENYSDIALISGVVLPAVLLFDKKIKRDWVDILFMYMETMSVTVNIFEWSFLGPTFQNRFRPVTYYTQLPIDERKYGNNRNSFYSGHVATVAASTFFMVKVYSDYNPSIGDDKYLLYAAAAIPPLILSYFRVNALKHFPSDVLVGLAVGALCGILIPEFHRSNVENVSMGLYSFGQATGLAIRWQPKFLK